MQNNHVEQGSVELKNKVESTPEDGETPEVEVAPEITGTPKVKVVPEVAGTPEVGTTPKVEAMPAIERKIAEEKLSERLVNKKKALLEEIVTLMIHAGHLRDSLEYCREKYLNCKKALEQENKTEDDFEHKLTEIRSKIFDLKARLEYLKQLPEVLSRNIKAVQSCAELSQEAKDAQINQYAVQLRCYSNQMEEIEENLKQYEEKYKTVRMLFETHDHNSSILENQQDANIKAINEVDCAIKRDVKLFDTKYAALTAVSKQLRLLLHPEDSKLSAASLLDRLERDEEPLSTSGKFVRNAMPPSIAISSNAATTLLKS